MSSHANPLGQVADWIGFTFTITHKGCLLRFRLTSCVSSASMWLTCCAFLRFSLIEAQSFAGRANHIASLLIAWRPFVSELWAAIDPESARRSGKVWVKQIKPTLEWLSTFLRQQRGALVRSWLFSAWLYPQTAVAMILDASPWGLGGILVSGDKVISWFASDLTALDEARVHHRIGQGSGQQL